MQLQHPLWRWPVVSLMAVGLLTVAAALTALLFWGLFYAHWDYPPVERIVNVFPIPAARFGDRIILYRDYFRDVRTVERYLSSEEAKSVYVARPLVPDDRKNVLERLIREAALQELAAIRRVQVTDEQIKAATDEIIGAVTSTQEFERLLSDNYGWKIADFQSHIIKPLLLTRLLTAVYAVDHGGDPQALERYLMERVQRPDVVRYLKFKSS